MTRARVSITNLVVRDIRFPTSRQLDGSDAMNPDPDYSAAWKLLGKARIACGDNEAAKAAYRQGITVAEKRGDLQAAKEMQVFLKRLERA